ncbi:hypothetical protein DXG01_006922 [Tephrocybe rancida]|nr:hypothetical protein DXG01_006922 [Tephrocybe rancida]
MNSQALKRVHRTAFRPCPRSSIPITRPSHIFARRSSSSSGPPPNEPTKTQDASVTPKLVDRTDDIFRKIQDRFNNPRPTPTLTARMPPMTPTELPASQNPRRSKAQINEARAALDAFKSPSDEHIVTYADAPGEGLDTTTEVLDTAETLDNAEDLVEVEEDETRVVTPDTPMRLRQGKLLELIVPPRLKRYPNPWFSGEDFRSYLLPLYQRGWELSFQKNLSANVVTHVLSGRTFIFNGWDLGISFFNAVNALFQEEHHHPIDIRISTSGHTTQVNMSFTTHAAFRSAWVKPEEVPVKAAGVTVRDFRIATLIEQLYSDTFGGDVSKLLPPAHRQPILEATHKLLNLPLRKLHLYCTACGGRHAIDECHVNSSRVKSLLPLCKNCNHHHAPMSMCPVYRKKKVDKPTSPCPNCQGDHWLEDCRKPQLPAGEAENMMIPLLVDTTVV